MSQVAAAFCMAVAGNAQAQLAASPAERPTPLSGVTVVARRPTRVSDLTVGASACPEPKAANASTDAAPAVVDSYPAQDAVMAPGPLIVRVSFGAPMSCDWDVSVQSSPGEADPCEPAGRWSLPARTTWSMACTLAPASTYVFRFGGGRSPFVGLSGRAAPPYLLRIATLDGPSTPTIVQAADPHAPPPGSVYVACSAGPVRQGESDCRRVVPPAR